MGLLVSLAQLLVKKFLNSLLKIMTDPLFVHRLR